MRFKTLTARYPGTCKRCGEAFEAGTTIRWALGKGNTWHIAADCPASQATALQTAAPEPARRLTDSDLRNAGAFSATGYGARRKAQAAGPALDTPKPGSVSLDFPIVLPAGSVDATGTAIPDPSLPYPKGGYPKSSLMAMAAALDKTSAA